MRPRLEDPTRTGRRAPRRHRLVVVTAAVALTAAACGGASDSSSADATTAPPAVEDVEVEQDVEDDGLEAEVAPASGIVDLIGPDVVEAAEIETNGLPSVVVDDVTSGRKVNFRNLVPQDRPILMWMWAPH